MATDVQGFDPIVKEHRVERFTFGSARPTPGANCVLIWKAANGTIYPLKSPPTLAESIVATFQVYEVDIQQHPILIEYALPSKNSAMTFKAVLRATWQVKQPEEVVRNLVRNAESVHDTWLNELLRNEGSKYDIEDREVEQKINGRLAQQIGHQRFGIAIIDLKIQISLDTATQQYVDELLRRSRQQSIDVVAAENQQRLDQLRSEREALEAGHRAEMARRQTELDIQLEAQRHEFTLKLKRDRMAFYTQALESGQFGLIVMQLVEHPEDVNSVLHFLLEERRIGFENSKKMIEALIEADVINPERLDRTLQTALDNVLVELTPATPGFVLPSGRRARDPIEATVAEATAAEEIATQATPSEPATPAAPGQSKTGASVDDYE